ncbi:MAG TPA: hypothetical protein VFU23_09590 [Gemmatimonadales bacterium]|nr:hypothetical protein [Gemmatimonadales bacterium]
MSSHRPDRTARGADAADSLPLPGARTLFARALRLRCPICAGHPVLLSWFTVAPSCPGCGFHLDRDEPGYWIGSYTVNLFLTEGAFAVVFVGGMFVTWPGVPWTALGILCAAVAVLTPIVIFPWTKLLYLAIDLVFRPVDPDDLTSPAEPGLARQRK